MTFHKSEQRDQLPESIAPKTQNPTGRQKCQALGISLNGFVISLNLKGILPLLRINKPTFFVDFFTRKLKKHGQLRI